MSVWLAAVVLVVLGMSSAAEMPSSIYPEVEFPRIVVVANEQLQEEREGEEAATARFQITRVQAAAFVERARALIKAGRPVCPFCSQPKDAGGHVCPRTNGYLVR